jgi:hypothetical protein
MLIENTEVKAVWEEGTTDYAWKFPINKTSDVIIL